MILAKLLKLLGLILLGLIRRGTMVIEEAHRCFEVTKTDRVHFSDLLIRNLVLHYEFVQLLCTRRPPRPVDYFD